jgi:hypothetical protein
MGNRIKGNFYGAIKKHNLQLEKLGEAKPDLLTRQSFQSSANSYLGIMRHHNTFRLRKYMVVKNVQGWWRYTYVNGRVTKFSLKP